MFMGGIMKKGYFYIFFLFILMGCAGSSTITSQYRLRILQASFENVFESTVDYLEERGFVIRKADLTFGTIETDFREGAGWAGRSMADKRAKVAAKVTKVSENEVKLTLKIISEERSEMTGWFQVEMSVAKEQIYYKNYFTGIERRIKSRGT